MIPIKTILQYKIYFIFHKMILCFRNVMPAMTYHLLINSPEKHSHGVDLSTDLTHNV